MADRWEFEKLGMGYRVWSDKLQTTFRLTHIKRSRGDLSGELSVTTNLASAKTHGEEGVLHVARFNVLSSSSRASLSRVLEKRTPGQDMDWFDGLEYLCQHVILAETKGELIEEVGTRPPTPPSDRWMIEPLVLKGRPALIFGPGGVGKSLIALTCALSVAVGREIIPGIAPAVHGPVLYLDWETTADVINDRIHAIASGAKFKPENVFYRRCVRPLADDAEELSAIVAQRGIVLVVVDSAAYAMGTQGEWGDANESVLRMHEALRLIGTTSQIVDHVNKTDARGKGGTASPYGSAYKTNAARISWEVRKAPSVSGLAINLYHAKSNDTAQLEPIGLSLEWTHDSIVFDHVEAVEDEPEEGEDTSAAILELIEVRGRLPSGDIVKLLHWIKPPTIRSTLSRLVSRGLLARDEAGVYSLVNQPVKLRPLPTSRGVYDA